jgi:hypothetical protein
MLPAAPCSAANLSLGDSDEDSSAGHHYRGNTGGTGKGQQPTAESVTPAAGAATGIKSVPNRAVSWGQDQLQEAEEGGQGQVGPAPGKTDDGEKPPGRGWGGGGHTGLDSVISAFVLGVISSQLTFLCLHLSSGSHLPTCRHPSSSMAYIGQ